MVIQKMLTDYYKFIEYDIKSRPIVLENIEKVINCGNPSYGGTMYGCPHCGNLYSLPFKILPHLWSKVFQRQVFP